MSSENQSSESPWSASTKGYVTSGVGKLLYCTLDGADTSIEVKLMKDAAYGGHLLAPTNKIPATDEDYVPTTVGNGIRTRGYQEGVDLTDIMLASIKPLSAYQTDAWLDVQLKFTTDG
jgi:hypothetical protein